MKQTTEILVIVIIPVYKVEKYLEKAVESVLNQTYRNIKIILVDDGSPDNSPAICEYLKEKYKNIDVIHKVNGGLSSARNAGLDSITEEPEYILFLDSDDCLEKNAILGMLNMAKRANADMVIPDRYIKIQESTGKSSVALHFTEKMYTDDPIKFALNVLIEKGRAWRAHSLLFSYTLIKKTHARFPENHIAEDITFQLQVLKEAKKIVIYPYPTVRYLKREGSITTSFQQNFDKEIWFIDEQVRKFLIDIKRNGAEEKNKADGLLCRNIVLYVFSIMSKRNTMPYLEKVKKAETVLNDTKAKGVVRHKCSMPWFEQKKVRFVVGTIYFLLRHHADPIAFFIMAIVQ